jgi:hypothetical protein
MMMQGLLSLINPKFKLEQYNLDLIYYHHNK